MSTTLVNANLGLRFLLELSALAAVGYWGLQSADGALRPVLALGAVGAVVLVWALFVSPKRAIELGRPLRSTVELLVWAAAGAALYSAASPVLGLSFAALAVASGAVNYAWS